MADANPNAIFGQKPMRAAALWAVSNVVVERCAFHPLAKHASEFHGHAHIAINAEFAGHEGGCGVLLTVEDRFENVSVGGHGYVSIVVTGACAVAVHDDAAFPFDHEFRAAVKTSTAKLGVQGFNGCGHNITHFFVLCFSFRDIATGSLPPRRYITVMGTLIFRFKRTVTAFFVLLTFSSPLAADEAVLTPLFDELLGADDTSHERVATEILREFERSGSAAMDLLYRRGADALEENEFGEAAEHFTALVDHAPDFAEGYHGRANAYFNLGYVGPALDDLRMTLQLQPKHFQALFGLGNVMETLERPEDALEVYQAVLEIYPLEPNTLAAIERVELLLRGQSL